MFFAQQEAPSSDRSKALDKKYGFGGKKSKGNTRESAMDDSGFRLVLDNVSVITPINRNKPDNHDPALIALTWHGSLTRAIYRTRTPSSS